MAIIRKGSNFHHFKKYRTQNYNYIDRMNRRVFEMGGYLVHCYPLIGVKKEDGTITDITENPNIVSDAVLNENYQRKYSRETFDLYLISSFNQPSWTFNSGIFSIIDGDEKEAYIHYNSMIEQLGRKLIEGDVLEFSFMRDLDILGKDYALNKFYVITESVRDDKIGWDANYHFHQWKIKMKPMPYGPEFADLINWDKPDDFYEDYGSENGGGGIKLEDTSAQNLLDQVDEIIKEAEGSDGQGGVSYRLHDEHQIFLNCVNGKFSIDNDSPYFKHMDGIPDNLNCDDVPYGTSFPNNLSNESYFLRIDYNPPLLYKNVGQTKTLEVENGLNFPDPKDTKDGDFFVKEIQHLENDEVVSEFYLYQRKVKEDGRKFWKLIPEKNNFGIKWYKENDTYVVEINNPAWKKLDYEYDLREKWTGVPAILRNIINNENTFLSENGEVIPMRQDIKDLVTVGKRKGAKVKKEHNKLRPWNKEFQQKIKEETGIEYPVIGIKNL